MRSQKIAVSSFFLSLFAPAAFAAGSLCEFVAATATKNHLSDAVADFKEIGSPANKDYFPETVYGDRLVYLKADINADGVEEHVAIATNGTAHIDRLYMRPDRPGSKTTEFSAYRKGSHDVGLLKISGAHYILGGQYNSPVKLWGIGQDLEEQLLCEFRTSKSPDILLVEGEGVPVCEARVDNGWQYVEYTGSHNLELPKTPDNRFWSKYPREGIARVDIDNNGTEENIVRLSFVHGGGRGCDTSYLVATNEVRTEIPEGGVNEILEDRLWGYPCGSLKRVFEYAGNAYIQGKGEREEVVYHLKGKKLDMPCRYKWSKSILPTRVHGE